MTQQDVTEQDEYPVDPARWRDSKYAAKPERAIGPFKIAVLRRGQIHDQPVAVFETWEDAIGAIVDLRMRPLAGRQEAIAVIGANGEQFPLDFIKGLVAKGYDD